MKIRNIFDIVFGGALVSTWFNETGPTTINVELYSIGRIKEWAEGIFEVGVTDSVGQISEGDLCRGFEKFDTMYGIAIVAPFHDHVYLNAVGLISETLESKTFEEHITVIGEILESVSDAYYYKIQLECVGQITEQVADGVLYWDTGFIKYSPYVGIWEKS
jgi:hypothetical protein